MISAATLGLLLVAMATLFEGGGQICLKRSVLIPTRRLYWIGLAIAYFIFNIALYSAALSILDLNVAFSVGSLTFVTTALLSQWLLREELTAIRWLGIGLILIGTSLIATQA